MILFIHKGGLKFKNHLVNSENCLIDVVSDFDNQTGDGARSPSEYDFAPLDTGCADIILHSSNDSFLYSFISEVH